MRFKKEHYNLMLQSLKKPLDSIPKELKPFFHEIEEKEQKTLVSKIISFFRRLLRIKKYKYIAKVNRAVFVKNVWGTFGSSKREGSLVILELRITVFTFSDKNQIIDVFFDVIEKAIYKFLEDVEATKSYHGLHQISDEKIKLSFREVDLVDYDIIDEIDLWHIDLIHHEINKKFSTKVYYPMVEK